MDEIQVNFLYEWIFNSANLSHIIITISILYTSLSEELSKSIDSKPDQDGK